MSNKKSTIQKNEKSFLEKNNILINALITLFWIILSWFISFYFANIQTINQRKYELDKQVMSNFLKDTIQYSNYYYINWKRLENEYWKTLDCSFMTEIWLTIKNDAKITKEQVAENCEIFDRFKIINLDFKRNSAEARIIWSNEILKILEDIDSSLEFSKISKYFDNIYDEWYRNNKFLADYYYKKKIADAYNEFIWSKFERLEKQIRKEFYK